MKKYIFYLFVCLLFIVFSCSKKENDNEEKYENRVDAAKDYIKAEANFLQVFITFDKVASDTLLYIWKHRIIDGADVILKHDTIFIDYGLSNVMCPDGKQRRGMMIAGMMGNYFSAGSYATVAFDTFYVDDVRFQGDLTIENNTSDPNTSSQIFTVRQGSSYGDIYFQANHMLRWGSAKTSFTFDGFASGASSKGVNFWASSVESILYSSSCEWGFVRGLINMGVSSYSVGSADIQVDFIEQDSCSQRVNFFVSVDGKKHVYPYYYEE